MDMAVGVIIRRRVHSTLSIRWFQDLLNPILGLITGGVMDFSDLTIPLGGTSINYGAFLTAVINFLLVALVIFGITKMLNSLHRKKEQQEEQEEALEKQPRLCPYCKSEIAEDATRCPHCTSHLDA